MGEFLRAGRRLARRRSSTRRGACVHQPFEGIAHLNARFKDGITIKAYPVEEKAGLLWAYLGPPDLPGSPDGVQPVYVNYPAAPAKSVASPPGTGGEISALTNTVDPPPAPMEQNPAWQEFNRQLGTTLKINVVAAPDYTGKLSTVMAGSDLPDLLYIYQGGPSPVPSLLRFLQATCADLTLYLAGDAVKDYPNLANFPTYNWQGTGTIYGNSIWGVPVPRSVLATSMHVHQELLDAIGAQSPTSADELKRLLQELTRPQENRWGIGSPARSITYLDAPAVRPND